MILIADSGSTKADWLLVNKDNDTVAEFYTKGFNPYFHNRDFILAELNNNFELNKYAEDIEELHFYGAGVSNEIMAENIKIPFSQYFTNAKLNIGHDLSAAAFATATIGTPSIACILGTGSNCCWYDGKGNVSQKLPALSYVLGDEGSGSYFGKKLMSEYFYKKMPDLLSKKLEEKYNMDKQEVFKNVYMKPNANVYLASFSRFLSDNKEDPYIRKIVENGLLIFIDIHVCSYENYKEVETNFIGSIAFFFEDILRDVAKRRAVNIGKIIKKPIYNLVKYHALLKDHK